LENSKKIYIELKEIKKQIITILFKQREVKVRKYSGNCLINKINDKKYQIIDYEYNICKIKLSKEYFHDKIIKIKFNKSYIANLKLREFKRYKLIVNIHPKDSKIILKDDYENKYYLNSGIPKLLYKGKYYYEFKKVDYIMENSHRKFIDLYENKRIDYKMIPSYLQFFKLYTAININIGKDLLYSSFVIGADIINWVERYRIITLGLSFNNNLTDNYSYLDLYSDFKFGENFYYGVTTSLLWGDKVKSFILGGLIEYEYKINKLFIKGRFSVGVSLFSDISDYFFYTIGGVFVGWNGF